MTLFQKPANNPEMLRIEYQVRRAVERGETVDYDVAPIYLGDNLVPVGVEIRAKSQSLDLWLFVVNRG